MERKKRKTIENKNLKIFATFSGIEIALRANFTLISINELNEFQRKFIYINQTNKYRNIFLFIALDDVFYFGILYFKKICFETHLSN